jgi:hypothetical protein
MCHAKHDVKIYISKMVELAAAQAADPRVTGTYIRTLFAAP